MIGDLLGKESVEGGIVMKFINDGLLVLSPSFEEAAEIDESGFRLQPWIDPLHLSGPDGGIVRQWSPIETGGVVIQGMGLKEKYGSMP